MSDFAFKEVEQEPTGLLRPAEGEPIPTTARDRLRADAGMRPYDDLEHYFIHNFDYELQGMRDSFREYIETADDPEAALAKVNAARFYSEALGIGFQEAFDNADVTSRAWWGEAASPVTAWESIKGCWEAGWSSFELGKLWAQARDEGMTDELAARIAGIEESMPPADKFKRILPTQALKGVASSAAYSLNAAPGALASKGVTALAALAVPEATLLIAALGQVASFVTNQAVMKGAAGGLEYRDMIMAGVDPELAKGASKWSGYVQDAIESFSVGQLMPGGRETGLIAKAANKIIGRAGLEGAVRQPFVQFLKRQVVGGFQQGSEEFWQQTASELAFEIVREASNDQAGTDIDSHTWKSIERGLADSFYQGFITNAPMTAVSEALFDIPADVQRYKAEQAVKKLQDAAMAAKERVDKEADAAPAKGSSEIPQPKAPITYRDYASTEESEDGLARSQIRGGSDPKSKAATVALDYATDPESGAISIEEVSVDAKLKRTDKAEAAAQTYDVVRHLRETFPSAEISWNPTDKTGKLIKKELEAENPEFFSSAYESGLETQAATSRRTAFVDKLQAVAGLEAESAESLAVVLDARAAKLGMDTDAFMERYFHPDMVSGELSGRGSERAAKMGDQGKGIYGQTSVWVDGQEVPGTSIVEEAANARVLFHFVKQGNTSGAIHEIVGHGLIHTLTPDERTLFETYAGKDMASWTATEHERMATDMEKYFETGKAPTPELQGAFERLAEYIKSVIEGWIQGKKLTPEAVAAFDSLFSKTETAVPEATEADSAPAPRGGSAQLARNLRGGHAEVRESGFRSGKRRRAEAAAEAAAERKADKADGLFKVASEKDHPDELGTMSPTGKKPVFDAVKDNPIVDAETMGLDQEAMDKAASIIERYPNFRPMPGASTDQKIRAFVDHVKANLLWLYDQVPEEVRSRSHLWYDGARAITEHWAKKYDLEERQVAGVMAVLSPQKDWFQNVSLAERVLDFASADQAFAWDQAMTGLANQTDSKGQPNVYRRGNNLESYARIEGKPYDQIELVEDRAMFLRLWHESHSGSDYQIVSPEGDFVGLARNANGDASRVIWSDFSCLAKAISIYEDGALANISAGIGNEHKVRNFYNNILVPNSRNGHVTIDTHAIAAALIRPLSGSDREVANNFGSNFKGDDFGPKGNANLGLSGLYPIYADAYREAAAERGILPREMQSITWEAVRGLFTDKFKANKKNVAQANEIWDTYKRGDIDADQARNLTSTLAGGIANPDWFGSDPGRNAQKVGTSYSGTLHGPSVRGRVRAGVGRGDRSVDPAVLPGSAGSADAPLFGGAGRVQPGELGQAGGAEGVADDGGRRLHFSQAFNAAHGLSPDIESVVAVHDRPDGTVVLEVAPEHAHQAYHDTLDRLRSAQPVGIQVSLKDAADYKGMRLFMASDDTAVAALDGADMVSVCASKRQDGSTAMPEIIKTVVEAGARTADCYGSFLPYYYSRFGFQPVARLGWSDEIWAEYAGAEVAAGRFEAAAIDPARLFKDWGGKVDYYFVAWTGDTSSFNTMNPEDVSRIPSIDDWGYGVAAQQAALEKSNGQGYPSGEGEELFGGADSGPLTEDEIEEATFAYGSEEEFHKAVKQAISGATMGRPPRDGQRAILAGPGAPVFHGDPVTPYRPIKRVNLVGQVVKSQDDLASLFALSRNPRTEIFQILYVDDSDTVLAHSAISSLLPSITSVMEAGDIDATLANVKDRAARLGATKVYLAHNHPSSRVEPSRQDIDVTKAYADTLGPVFAGHIITNHTKYSIIDKTLACQVQDMPAGLESYVHDSGSSMNSPKAIATAAAGVLTDARTTALVILNNQNVITGWTYLKGDPLMSRVKHLVRMFGGRTGAIVTHDISAFYSWMNEAVTSRGSEEDVLLDILQVKKGSDFIMSSMADRFLPGGGWQDAAARAHRKPVVVSYNEKHTELFGGSVDSPEFKRWFGDSRVVDEDGKPLVQYHTSLAPDQFTEFRRGDMGIHFGTSEQANSIASDLKDTPVTPHTYQAYLSIQNPLRLKDRGRWHDFLVADELLGMGIITRQEREGLRRFNGDGRGGDDYVIDLLKKAGYDGIVYLNRREGITQTAAEAALPDDEYSDYDLRMSRVGDQEFLEVHPEARDSWMAFDPTQIKSVSNKGTWDHDDERILFGGAESDLADLASGFSSYQDFAAAYNAMHELDGTSADDREASLRKAWLRADVSGEQAGAQATARKEADRDFLTDLKQLEHQGLKDFLEAFGAVMYADKKAARGADPVQALALRVADGQTPTMAQLDMAMRLIEAAPSKYRRLFAKLSGDPDMLAQIKAEKDKATPEVDWKPVKAAISPKKAAARLLKAVADMNDPAAAARYISGDYTYGMAIDEAKGVALEIQDLRELQGLSAAEIQSWRKQFSLAEKRLVQKRKQLASLRADLRKARAIAGYKGRRGKAEAANAGIAALDAKIAALEAEAQARFDALPSRAAMKAVAYAESKKAARAAVDALKVKIAEAKARQAARDKAIAIAKAILAPVAKNTDWKVRKQIEAIQRTIDPHFRRKMNTPDLDAIRAMFTESANLSKLLPKDVLDRLRKRPLNEWTIAELEDLRSRVDALRELGQIRLAERNAERRQARNDIVRMLTEALAKSGKYHDAPMYGSAEFDDMIEKDQSLLKKWDLSLTTIHRVTKILDNGESRGWWYTTFVERERGACREEANGFDRRWLNIEQKIKELGLKIEDLYAEQVTIGDWTISKMDAIGLYIGLQDDSTMAKIVFGNMMTEKDRKGLPEQQLEALAEKNLRAARTASQTLSVKERELAEFLIKDASTEFDRLSEACYLYENREPPKVAVYFPNEVHGRAGEDKLVDQMREDLLARTPRLGRGVQKGMTVGRIQIGDRNQLPITLDALGVYKRGIQRQEHYIAYAQLIKDWKLMINNDRTASELRYLVKQTHGQGFLDYIDAWVDEAANPKAYTDYQKPLEGFEQAFRFLRGPLASAYLGLRSSTALRQLITSPIPYFPYAPAAMLSRMVKHVSPAEFMKAYAFAKESSPFIRNRIASPTLAAIKEYAKAEGTSKQMKKLARVSGVLIEAADIWAVVTGWTAIYDKTLAELSGKEGLSVAEMKKRAIEEADRITIETQPTGRMADVSPAFKSGSEVQKFLLAFQGPLNVVYNQLFHDVPADMANGHVFRAVGTISGYMATGAIIAFLATPRGDDDDDEMRSLRILLAGAIRQPLDAIPLVGNPAGDALEALVTGERRFRGSSQIFPGMEKLFGGLGGMMTAEDEEAFWKNFLKIAEGSGMLYGVPVSALKEYYRAIILGDLEALLGRPQS